MLKKLAFSILRDKQQGGRYSAQIIGATVRDARPSTSKRSHTRAPSNAAPTDPSPLPPDYKEIALQYGMTHLRDPYSAHINVSDEPPTQSAAYPGLQRVILDQIRADINQSMNPMAHGAEWAAPLLNAWAVKLYVNAKNAFGAYTGERLIIVLIQNGKAVYAVDASQL